MTRGNAHTYLRLSDNTVTEAVRTITYFLPAASHLPRLVQVAGQERRAVCHKPATEGPGALGQVVEVDDAAALRMLPRRLRGRHQPDLQAEWVSPYPSLQYTRTVHMRTSIMHPCCVCGYCRALC